MRGRTTIPFQLGNDITQYQNIAKNYFIIGDGVYVRPGGTYRVAWNGLDGLADTVCLLSLRKRDDPANICASEPVPSSMTTNTATPTSTVTSNTAIVSGDVQSISSAAAESAPTSSTNTKPKSEGSVVIYHSIDHGCNAPLADYNQIFCIYSVPGGSQPQDICKSALQSTPTDATTASIAIELPQFSSEILDFK